MEFLFEDDSLVEPRPTHTARMGEGSVFDRSFPTRVAALLRFRPIADLAAGGMRQEWPEGLYDLPSLALATIDLVIAQQGLEYEAIYPETLEALTDWAAQAAPDRTREEHAKVARYVLDGLLNRSARETPFTYRISDYGADGGHRQRQVQFRLLVEREDPVRGEVVLNATGDAINALVGGLEFEVEDEQVANEILLERQLARGAFAAAERSAVRARLLSVGLSERFQALTKATRRDLFSVVDAWSAEVPKALDAARDHIRGRIDVEHRLLVKVRESVASDDLDVASVSLRIESLLHESRRRHELLHRHVMDARATFLEEQDRQAFRPVAPAHLPDLHGEVFSPLIELPTAQAEHLVGGFFADLAGPRAPRLPRLYRVLNDLWSQPGDEAEERPALEMEELDGVERPWIDPAVLAHARAVVATEGLPVRLSRLIATCLAGSIDAATGSDETNTAVRQKAAEITALAALWCYADDAPGETDGESPNERADLAVALFGPRAAVDADEHLLQLPGWSGDDLVIAPEPDLLLTADPEPVVSLIGPQENDDRQRDDVEHDAEMTV